MICLSLRSRAANHAKKENLAVFIRFGVHAAEAGMKIKGAEPSARCAGCSEAEA